MGMSDFYGDADEADGIATIHRALDLGVTFLDTADMYGPYTNEQLVGQAIARPPRRGRLATKFGIVRGPNGERLGINGTPDYVRAACDASLQRLGVDHIDLYYQHRVDQTRPDRGDRRRDGRAGRGGQGAPPRPVRGRAADTSAAPTPCTRSPRCRREYSLWTRDLEDEILPTSASSASASSPTARSAAASSPARSRRAAPTRADDRAPAYIPRFQGENLDANLALVEQVTRVAAEKGCTPGQLALAWVLAQGDDIVPIPGTKRVTYLEENLGAPDVELTADDLAALEQRRAPRRRRRRPLRDMSHIDVRGAPPSGPRARRRLRPSGLRHGCHCTRGHPRPHHRRTATVGDQAPAFTLVGPDLTRSLHRPDLTGPRRPGRLPQRRHRRLRRGVREYTTTPRQPSTTPRSSTSRSTCRSPRPDSAAPRASRTPRSAPAFRTTLAKDFDVTLTNGKFNGLLARSVVVIDASGKVSHTELVPNIGPEPDYDAALAALD